MHVDTEVAFHEAMTIVHVMWAIGVDPTKASATPVWEAFRCDDKAGVIAAMDKLRKMARAVGP